MSNKQKEAYKAMSVEEIMTFMQLADNDKVLLDMLTPAQHDEVIKASIDNACKAQEATGKMPTFEEWLAYRAKLVYDMLQKT